MIRLSLLFGHKDDDFIEFLCGLCYRIKVEKSKKGLVVKRLPEPEIKRFYASPENPYDLRVMRKELPPHWLLSELLFHTITICLDAYERVSARMLLDSVLSMQDAEKNKDAFFGLTYTISYKKDKELHDKFEEKFACYPGEYLRVRNEAIPQYQIGVDAGNFLLDEYRHLPGDLRVMIDFAFSGFIFNAVNSPDFLDLCKNKDVDISSMTFEQKLNEELDYEALHNRLMVQLGHA